MKTYASIKAEIAKLEKQAESAKRAEVAGVVARIKEAIAAYALTAHDLGLGNASRKPGARGKGAKIEVARKSTVGVAKYRDPATGKTWTGQGRPPAWVMAVADRDSLLIGGPMKAAAGGKNAVKASRGAKRAAQRRNVAGAKKAARQAAKTPAVQIESGAASE